MCARVGGYYLCVCANVCMCVICVCVHKHLDVCGYAWYMIYMWVRVRALFLSDRSNIASVESTHCVKKVANEGSMWGGT